ncbi:MAG: hypothetical protein HFF06_10945 [Oscillospiraceae bacterium]|jgi:hypothetical protein|nr:hypothetical protein [Oscillospiraceae bacterium]
MSRKRDFVLLTAGILVGTVLAPTAAHAVSEVMAATRSYQPIYIDGQQVQMEAYAVNGNNYVKLRDVGQIVGFEVYWDGKAVQIVSDKPYTGLPPVQAPAPADEDYSAQANPSTFSAELTPAIYNAVRYTVVNQDGIMTGQEPVNMGPNVTRNSSLDNALAGMGHYPIYELLYRDNGYVCNVRYPEAYHEAAAHTQGFVDSLNGLDDGEKVEAICWYVVDHITYDTTYAGPNKVLVQDGEIPGSCMAYSASFQFLCNRANIPCILLSSQTHQWTMVYVDGQWWDVDATSADGTSPEDRHLVHVMTDPSERYGSEYVDQDPAATLFAQEALVPGSTK